MSRSAFWVIACLCAGSLAAETDKREELGPARVGTFDVATSGAEGVPLIGDGADPQAVLTPGLPRPAARAYRLVPAPGEFRGAWLHWQDYLTPAAIARTIDKATRARLNVLLPLANYPDQAMWRSLTIPVNPRVAPGFDPLRELVAQAHAAGIQVHPYLVTLNGGLTKHPGIRPDWYAVDPAGNRVGGWLNPSHPEVREFLMALVTELAQTGVDGIHYDYIRHEYDSDYDYGEATRRRFTAEHGFDPLDLRHDTVGGEGMRLLQTSFHTGPGASLLTQQKQFLRNAGYQPPVTPERFLDKLPAETVLVAGNLYYGKVKFETLDKLLDFVERGGVLVVLDGPEATAQSRRMTELFGIGGKGYFDRRSTILTVLRGPDGVTEGIQRQIDLDVRGNACPTLGDAKLLALFDDGTPAVVTKDVGRGGVVVFNFHCYQGEAADNPEVLQLFSRLVDWQAERHGIQNTTRRYGDAARRSPSAWLRWRVEEVTKLVRALTTAARSVRPDIITSAAGGAQREDLHRLKRDGLGWLRRNEVQFLCPMAYTTDNRVLARRLDDELAPVREPELRQMLFVGIGVYKSPKLTQRWLEQIALARARGFRGVCLFAFEDLTESLINALAAGPFREPAPVPWQQVPAVEP